MLDQGVITCKVICLWCWTMWGGIARTVITVRNFGDFSRGLNPRASGPDVPCLGSLGLNPGPKGIPELIRGLDLLR